MLLGILLGGGGLLGTVLPAGVPGTHGFATVAEVPFGSVVVDEVEEFELVPVPAVPVEAVEPGATVPGDEVVPPVPVAV